jgi:hypothetical protein
MHAGNPPPLIAAQGLMDDTTLIVSTREQSSEQFGKLKAFLGAYGMVVNPGPTWRSPGWSHDLPLL